ncbi:30S ribosomal protein S5 [Candidatus Woesearchaeota archaeon]|nr:30S ribosomal protein S5 [Candidatus Woesearchaeota archaeon]MBI2130936.1 30S ribosomal protein S5 [Candidatus Woesearchaeota archaeon]
MEEKITVAEETVPPPKAEAAVAAKPQTERDSWKPKTSIGRKVKEGLIKDIDSILDKDMRVLESEIVDILMPDLSTDLLMVGQSKGKFGGGQKRVFRQTQKKTQEGNKPKFATIAVAGNQDGYVGIGYGKSKETVPAREKSIRNAKLSIIKIRRGCGDWRCGCREPHTVPFTVEGKVGSVVVKLQPAPKGIGLKIEKECGKILKLAGIKDVWAKATGQTSAKINLFYACFGALQKLMDVKVSPKDAEELGIVEGRAKK